MIAVQWVWLAGLAFFVTHLGVSSTGLRGVLQARLGAQGYLGLYSAFAFVTLALLIFTYTHTPHAPLTWLPLYAVPKLVMPVALLFIVGGFTVPNPTAVGAEGKLSGEAARGMLRITRHPVQWGLLLWAASHVLANGDAASIGFFGSMGAVSALGMLAMDHRKSKLPEWPQFADATSLVPFVAIASGRNRFVPGELVLPLAIAAPLTVAVWFAHIWIAGVAIP